MDSSLKITLKEAFFEKKFSNFFHVSGAPDLNSPNFFVDDLDVSPDFFDYFRGTRWLLEKDPTLYCVSAWNDNGKPSLIDKNAHDLLYRSDFFPGLGWMLTRLQLYLEFLA